VVTLIIRTQDLPQPLEEIFFVVLDEFWGCLGEGSQRLDAVEQGVGFSLVLKDEDLYLKQLFEDVNCFLAESSQVILLSNKKSR